jgi:flavin-binding protein dodecin
MTDHVYKTIELVGASSAGIQDAVKNAIAKAGETVRLMRWFEVIETRGTIENDRVMQWQVTVKVGFRLEE